MKRPSLDVTPLLRDAERPRWGVGLYALGAWATRESSAVLPGEALLDALRENA